MWKWVDQKCRQRGWAACALGQIASLWVFLNLVARICYCSDLPNHSIYSIYVACISCMNQFSFSNDLLLDWHPCTLSARFVLLACTGKISHNNLGNFRMLSQICQAVIAEQVSRPRMIFKHLFWQMQGIEQKLGPWSNLYHLIKFLTASKTHFQVDLSSTTALVIDQAVSVIAAFVLSFKASWDPVLMLSNPALETSLRTFVADVTYFMTSSATADVPAVAQSATALATHVAAPQKSPCTRQITASVPQTTTTSGAQAVLSPTLAAPLRIPFPTALAMISPHAIDFTLLEKSLSIKLYERFYVFRYLVIYEGT